MGSVCPLDLYRGIRPLRVCCLRVVSAHAVWRSYETPVSTQCSETSQEARVSESHEHTRWPSCHPIASPEGPRSSVGMIERLSGRPSFAELHARGTRTGRGPMRLVSCVDLSQRVRIGYAIPRSVGSAVVRNRLRRRLRAVLAELDNEVGLPGGKHLVRVSAPLTDWSHAKLRTTMADLMQRSAGTAIEDLEGGPS